MRRRLQKRILYKIVWSLKLKFLQVNEGNDCSKPNNMLNELN